MMHSYSIFAALFGCFILLCLFLTSACGYDYTCYVCRSSDFTSSGEDSGCPSTSPCCKDPFADRRSTVGQEDHCRFCLKAKYTYKKKGRAYTARFCYNPDHPEETEKGHKVLSNLLNITVDGKTQTRDGYLAEKKREMEMIEKLEKGECVHLTEHQPIGTSYREICGCVGHFCNNGGQMTLNFFAIILVLMTVLLM